MGSRFSFDSFFDSFWGYNFLEYVEMDMRNVSARIITTGAYGMNDLALSTLQLCFTSMLLVTLLNSRREARRQRRKATYWNRKRRGPLRKERHVWDYDKWHDDEFKVNYRMSKDNFRELVRAVGASLPGWTQLS